MGKCILAGHPPAGGQIGYGTYTGNCAATRKITTGVTPKWVLVIPNGCIGYDTTYQRSGLAVYGRPAYCVYDSSEATYKTVEITTGGFNVFWCTPVKSNETGITYSYIYGT